MKKPHRRIPAAKTAGPMYGVPISISNQTQSGVYDAIFSIRSTPGNEGAIETAEQIESLCLYEGILRERHEQMLKTKPSICF